MLSEKSNESKNGSDSGPIAMTNVNPHAESPSSSYTEPSQQPKCIECGHYLIYHRQLYNPVQHHITLGGCTVGKCSCRLYEPGISHKIPDVLLEQWK